MRSALAVDHLTKVFPAETKGGSDFVAVNDISFELHKGEILGLLGPNGAGKSTTINMLLGVLSPTRGDIAYFGQDFLQHRSEALQHVTFASTYIKMPWRLTVMENLRIYALLYDIESAAFERRAERFLSYFGVWDQRHKTMNQLSAGQITRIMLAKAFIPHPKIVLLDEPTASLDPDVAHQVRAFIKDQQETYNTSILYTSHNMDEVADVCDRVIFLQKGSIVAQDSPENLAASVAQLELSIHITKHAKKAVSLAQKLNISVTESEGVFSFEVGEQIVADFLQQLAAAGVVYDTISLDRPSLEDYFLQLAFTDEANDTEVDE